jgi:hypothetical protein
MESMEKRIRDLSIKIMGLETVVAALKEELKELESEHLSDIFCPPIKAEIRD